MKTVIVIPTYNEKENIVPLTREIFNIMPLAHLLVVDDNSPDGTGQAVRDFMKAESRVDILSRSKKDGLGGAYIAGFKKVLADPEVTHIIMMDGDFSHNPKYIPEMIKMTEKYDLITGSRYVSGGGIEKWELWRRLLSRFANLYVRLILQKPLHDWTSGFNCIRADFLKKTNFQGIDLSGYAFLQELKYMLLKNGARPAELPIVFESRRGGESKISGFIITEGIIGPWRMRMKK